MQTPEATRIDKRLLRASFDRAAAGYDDVAVLQLEVASRLLERLDLIRIAPARIADLGAGTGTCTRALATRYRRSRVFALDLAPAMVRLARRRRPRLFPRQHFVCGDAERLPFPNGAFDLVLSSLTFQWCVDLPGTFSEVRRVLAPGGLFLFSTFGPDTLWELRESWRSVDPATHVNAFVDMHDLGDLLVAGGFRDVVMDVDRLTETFPDVVALMRSLKRIGAHNVNAGRSAALTPKGRLARMSAAYEQHRRAEGLPASYEVIYAHAWAPLAPGSVAVPLELRRGTGP